MNDAWTATHALRVRRIVGGHPLQTITVSWHIESFRFPAGFRTRMIEGYLQVTYRKGRPFAAYYRPSGVRRRKSVRCKEVRPGMVIDFAADGSPLGIEIVEPQRLTVAAFNRVLRGLGFPKVTASDLAPLRGSTPETA